MRTVSGGEATILAARTSAQHLKIEIKNAGGSWLDYSSPADSDWQVRCEIAQDVNQRVAQATVELAREAYGYNLSPLMNTEIDVGRAIRISGSRVAIGSAASYKLLFQGVVDSWDASSDPMVLVARDDGGSLVDRWVESETQYGSEAGVPIEDVMQEILDDWAGGLVLYVPSSPGFDISPAYSQQKESVLDALQTLADLIGWVLEYRWDNSTSAFRLTFYEPDRAPSVTDWDFGPNDYYTVPGFSVDRTDIRNAISVKYTDGATGERLAATPAEDAGSIAAYGRRWMEIEEADDSSINTGAQASAMAANALADLALPICEQEIETDLFWPIQLDDFYGFLANDVHYSVDQAFAVTGFVHTFENGCAKTNIKTRGVGAVSHTLGWLKRGTRERPDVDKITALELRDFRIVARDATTITYGWRLGSDLADAIAFYDTAVEPFDDANYADPATDTPDDVVTDRVAEYVVSLPAAGSLGYLLVAGRRADASLGEIERATVFRTIVASSEDLGDGTVISSKMAESSRNYGFSGAFSATDWDTVAWSAGTLYLADGTTYSIASGNTGNLADAALRYIYFDASVSPTVLQVTTSLATATTGDGRIFICVLKRAPDAAQAPYFVPSVGVIGLNGSNIGPESITDTHIVAEAIAAHHIQADAIQADHIASNTLSTRHFDAVDLTTVGARVYGTLHAAVIIASESFTAPDPVFDGTVTVENGLGRTSVVVNASGGLGRVQCFDDAGDFGGQIGAISGESFGVSAVESLLLSGNEIVLNSAELAFFAGAPATKPTVTGSRGGNAALASLLTALHNLGLITNSSS